MIGGVDFASSLKPSAWNIATGESVEVADFPTHTPNGDILTSPNGQISTEIWIDSSSYPVEGSIRLIDTTTGEILQELIEHEVILGEGFTELITTMTFNRDGSLLATVGADKAIYLWNTQTGGLLNELALYSKAVDITFSPDGRYIAAAGRDGRVQVWGLPTP